MKVLVTLAGKANVHWLIALLALAASLTFTFLVYPAIAGSYDLVLDSDNHGPLGYGIWKLHTFSYYPSSEPASDRGPLYPAFIALALALTNGWWPHSVQLEQCLIFSVLCLLVFWIAKTLWNRPLAVLASSLCAIHPFLIWYTSRIWIETTMTLMFTALIGSIVYFKQRPTPWRAALVGVILGLSLLGKSVYAPFLLLTPLLLLVPRGRRVSLLLAAIVFLSAVAVAAPWIVRNGRLTGTYAPVVGLAGFTFHQGNDFVEDFAIAPFSVNKLFSLSIARIKSEPVMLPPDTPDTTALQRENAVDAARGHNAIEKLKQSPGFLLKKIAYDAALFWTLGDTPAKSLLISVLQLPLIGLFIASLIRRRYREPDIIFLCAALVVAFYLAHLPTIALARYSVVLVPTMLIVGVGAFASSGPHEARMSEPAAA
jgi:4-amino-4-deoxy-L-arabinose transferase-like glycosyltransferase